MEYAMAEQTPKGAQRLDTATELAFDRTRAAYERTMMAWIRTATSLITFGFTIYKFFQIEAPDRGRQNRLIGPRQFAFILVSIGLFSLILATLEHTKYPYAWSAVCGQAALTGSAGRRIDLRPRDTCTSRDNFSSISIIHIDTTRGKMLISRGEIRSAIMIQVSPMARCSASRYDLEAL
jgi:putative membrane protein